MDFTIHNNRIHKIMELLKYLEDETWKKIFLGAITLMLLLVRMFQKLPNTWVQTYRKKKQLEGLQKELEKWKLGSKISAILRPLKMSGAIYIHVIRYFNGGNYKMTVEWEELGTSCANCIPHCKQWPEIKPLQDKWINVPVEEDWNLVLQKTIILDGKINDVDGKELDQLHKDMWDDWSIHSYKEILLVHKENKQTWTLGLSFCERFSKNRESNLMMEMAARQLREVLKVLK